MAERATAVVVGIAGGSGAGKSWLARRLCAGLGERAALLEQDWYYRDLSGWSAAQLATHNFDCPEAVELDLLARDLAALRAGRPAAAPRYDFATHRRAPAPPIPPRPVIVVEGLFVLAAPALRALLDFKVFVDAPEELRRQRRLARDQAERGIGPAAAERQFAATVAPMHVRWIEPSCRWADFVAAPEALDSCAAAVLRWLDGHGGG